MKMLLKRLPSESPMLVFDTENENPYWCGKGCEFCLPPSIPVTWRVTLSMSRRTTARISARRPRISREPFRKYLKFGWGTIIIKASLQSSDLISSSHCPISVKIVFRQSLRIHMSSILEHLCSVYRYDTDIIWISEISSNNWQPPNDRTSLKDYSVGNCYVLCIMWYLILNL